MGNVCRREIWEELGMYAHCKGSVSKSFLVVTLNAVLTWSRDPTSNCNKKCNHFILQLYMKNIYQLLLLYFSLYYIWNGSENKLKKKESFICINFYAKNATDFTQTPPWLVGGQVHVLYRNATRTAGGITRVCVFYNHASFATMCPLIYLPCPTKVNQLHYSQ